MPFTDPSLLHDVQKIRQIPILKTLLEVVCRTTGMGFAAVARVTQRRWIACEVRDEINFGLEPGGELKIETTICNEIRDHNKPVVIDHVATNSEYCDHHTPRLYGFQSYISVPITKKNGEFFGTLCAIDPKPAVLDNPKTLGMFALFADLVAFHLESIELVEHSQLAVTELNRQLKDSTEENHRYQYISNHNLQEPLRKMRVFTDILVNAVDEHDVNKTREIARKINFSAQRFSMMIQDLSDFSLLKERSDFQLVDLNKVIADVCTHLREQLAVKEASVDIDYFPTIYGIRLQLEQLFFRLVSNAIKFAKKGVPLDLKIKIAPVESSLTQNPQTVTDQKMHFVDIQVQDNGIGIQAKELERIFDLFSRSQYADMKEGNGIGLAYCRKIVRNHNGVITAQSTEGVGTTFSVLLAVNIMQTSTNGATAAAPLD